ncbi:hypothetical protein CN918_30345 [Priestia megaterium]|nr:hypothetical protein CN918_30345 [Priestia megaterium]
MIKLLISFLLIRLQILFVSAGGFIWIQGFHLSEKSVIYLPIGFVCIVFILYALIPYPHDKEREQWEALRSSHFQH